jgi:ABC-type phosphate/phosphonate transport system ATPase subunit
LIIKLINNINKLIKNLLNKMKLNFGSINYIINRVIIQNNHIENIELYKTKTIITIKKFNNYLKQTDTKKYDRILDDIGIAYIAYAD